MAKNENMYRELDRSTRNRRRRRRRRRRLNPFPLGVLALLLILIGGFVVWGSQHIWNAKPQLALVGAAEETVEAGTEYVDPGATATLKGEDISDQIQVSGAVDTSQVSDYTLTYSVPYRGQNYSISRKVSVEDHSGPELLLNDADQEVVVSSIDLYEEPGFSAVDAVEGDLTGKVQVDRTQVDENTWKILYIVTDSLGNTSQTERVVKIQAEPETTEAESTEAKPNEGESIICLTFDDGPSSKVTPRILDILAENGVKATFFIINYEDSMIPILKRMVDEGHTIGIHTWSHEYSECYATMDSYYDGVIRMRDKLKEDIGYEAFCCRFPGGSSNTVSRKYTEGVMTYLAEKMPVAGFQYYDWNADSTDAEGNNRPADTLYSNAVAGFKKDRTNILLCHDTNAKETTADALQRIIDYGVENGYSFQAITPDTYPVHHGINN